jgi:nicotinate-nucleotide--dimethylbenzimidazole phosphoribosyltransferase
MTDADDPFAAAAARVRPLDEAAMRAAAELHGRLTKPAGALGALEDLGILLSGISGEVPPPVPVAPAVAVFAGDHGVALSGVTPWPQEVTRQMVANFCAGGAAISVLARQHSARLVVVDVGVAGACEPHELLWDRNVRRGTADLSVERAMTSAEAGDALATGATVAAELVAAGADLLITGEMGIGNTTAAAAVIAALTGEPVTACTGRGTGIDDAMLQRKIEVVTGALARLPAGAAPTEIVAEVGGLELAALAGFVVGGVAARVPVVVDGVITLAAALVAEALVPGIARQLIAGHRSSEPGASVALRHLGLDPLVDLRLRLGEGSGAALALPLVRSAALVLGEMATFDGAGIIEK